MGRISAALDGLARRGEGALVAYIMAGYPDAEATVSAARGLARGGADVIELGFPFSDPLADGPAIQRAASASLANGTDMPAYHDMVRRVREFTDVPLVAMTYSNVAYGMGYERFVSGAVRHGIDGFILPDMPLEESGEYLEAVRRHGADAVFLVSPNTETGRAARIARASTGFLYMVAVYGTTGARTGVRDYAVRALKRIKGAAGGMPVGAGFGISGAGDVRTWMEAGADAVIVGSAIIGVIEGSGRGDMQGNVESFARSLKDATRPAARA